MKRITLAALPAALLAAMPVLADAPPPAGTLPLSQIVGLVEARPDFGWIEDVSWDDDGYYEVDYHTTSGAEVELRLNPTTGEEIRRR